MKTITEKEFLSWANNNGMGMAEGFPDVAILTFKPDLNHDRFWIIPAAPERRPYFIVSILEQLGHWDSCFVWRHSGSWPDEADPYRLNDQIEFHMLEGIGMNMGTADIIEFSKEEIAKLTTLIFTNSIFGWSIQDDLYIVPDNAKYIVQTDHHGVIHVSFKNPQDMEQFILHMDESKFPLPDDMPDATFKYPDWMKNKGK